MYKEIERGMESKLLGYKILDFIDEFLQPQTEKFDCSRKMKTLIGSYGLEAIIVVATRFEGLFKGILKIISLVFQKING